MQSMGQQALIPSTPTPGIGVVRVDVANVLSRLLNVAGFIENPEPETVQGLELERLPAHDRQQPETDRLT
jgi:hypothetical protein